ncbi:GNAT family N-acetyltransferase [Aeromicrobium chenweiae]|uniref:GNAT family N-acetyltransferase n=1 Tax=Aeromicrobium chenweiae TaxID=2079793 RepID=A0A2S0WR07_9ACTN|nr:GNAT family N-acetyltransferase [Aeromicrobium chenweiae]AWB93795.1 GNAT family N-acetyltransferase [Aeromicrobium chenweiae]TGN30840.1 GNAT family N-acetyltransferase [Aeromicrobium chenweiae]
MTQLEIRRDDVTGAEVVALLEQHLAEMASHTPAESVHALPVDRLAGPDVTFWSAWSGGRLAGCGALKDLSPVHAEIKSMRVADDFRRQGVGEVVLLHLLDEARRRGATRVSLETGSNPPFEAARRLYARHGFVECEPFADYVLDPWSMFMTLRLP